MGEKSITMTSCVNKNHEFGHVSAFKKLKGIGSFLNVLKPGPCLSHLATDRFFLARPLPALLDRELPPHCRLVATGLVLAPRDLIRESLARDRGSYS